jgi:hypothetical protein
VRALRPRPQPAAARMQPFVYFDVQGGYPPQLARLAGVGFPRFQAAFLIPYNPAVRMDVQMRR